MPLRLDRFLGAVTELVRWGEPWDIEDDDDPLLADEPAADEPASLAL